jgi:CheY-like chemotaxis protein
MKMNPAIPFSDSGFLGGNTGAGLMIRKGVEFTVRLIEPGLWKWQFQIGEAVTSGKINTRLIGLAIRRAEFQIDRALRKLGAVAMDLQPTDIVSGKRVLPQGTPMKRVLVVDDDPLICGAIRAWLEQREFAVVVADGGEAGLNALECSTFDLMIVDIVMPHMNGFESIRVFHQRAPTVPLIAISGYVFVEQRTSAPDFLSMALRLGATRCLRKPFTPSTLLSVIDTCLLEAESRRIRAIV